MLFLISKRKGTRKSSTKQSKKPLDLKLFYLLLAIFFVLYIVFQRVAVFAVIFGAGLFFSLILILIFEISNGVAEEGYTKNIIEIVVAVVVVLVLWYGLKYVLNTQYPLDVVPSCSMLPSLQRGDMILLEGANASTIRAPIVNVNATDWNSTFANIDSVALECIAYNVSGQSVHVSQILSPGYTVGLYEKVGNHGQIVQNSSQTGLIKYSCGVANIKYENGTVAQEAYTNSITIANTTITGDLNNSIVVYQTMPQDLFYQQGDSYIVHRVYAIVNASGTDYYLTKGDNNPGLDIQYYNYPSNQSALGGKVIGSLPYIGYLKLILSNNFVEPTGCNYTVQN